MFYLLTNSDWHVDNHDSDEDYEFWESFNSYYESREFNSFSVRDK